MKVNGKCTAQSEEHEANAIAQAAAREGFVCCLFVCGCDVRYNYAAAARHISRCVFVSTILFETKIIDGSHVQREEGTAT